LFSLSDATLPVLTPRLEVPTYDRRRLTPAIVHLGVGAFHRAHQATYLDAVARSGSLDWGEVGVSLRSSRMHSRLHPQDCLFTVVEHDEGGAKARVVGVLGDYHFAPESAEVVVGALADPRTRIVSMTITGDGYTLDASGRLDAEDRGVRHDLMAPHRPSTWFGFVVEGLARRRAAGLPGLTVLSCDNLQANGEAARSAVVGFAALRDESLAAWIERNVSFPSSMVDRITPQPGDSLSAFVARQFGVLDRAPVETEGFTQWIVEDEFCQGRPPLDDVGVQLVSDVGPYKLVKSRLLNGTHSAMAYLGCLAGFDTAAEMVANPTMRAFLEALMREEVVPLLPSPPGMHLDLYVDTVLARLADPNVGDTLARLCGRGSTKVPAYLLPSLVEARRAGRPSALLTLAVAAWFRYLRGTDLSGDLIDVQDARLDQLQPLARQGGCDPAPLLGARTVMGDLCDDRTLHLQLRSALRDIDDDLFGAVQTRLGGRVAAGTGRRVGNRASDLIA
jgi:fructuronate reductase/mannitol 2-dehydrogenase